MDGGKSIDVPVTLDRIPLYVRAGSILPLGPDVEFAAEKPADPIELRVYRGADASFTLYEDENDSYRYEKGAYATIPISWDEAAKTLTIGDRHGDFPGMLATRTFRVVLVEEGRGVGIGVRPDAGRAVRYDGKSDGEVLASRAPPAICRSFQQFRILFTTDAVAPIWNPGIKIP